MTKEEFKARVSMAYDGREHWELFLKRVWQLHVDNSRSWVSVEDELPPNKGGFSDEVLTYHHASKSKDERKTLTTRENIHTNRKEVSNDSSPRKCANKREQGASVFPNALPQQCAVKGNHPRC